MPGPFGPKKIIQPCPDPKKPVFVPSPQSPPQVLKRDLGLEAKIVDPIQRSQLVRHAPVRPLPPLPVPSDASNIKPVIEQKKPIVQPLPRLKLSPIPAAPHMLQAAQPKIKCPNCSLEITAADLYFPVCKNNVAGYQFCIKCTEPEEVFRIEPRGMVCGYCSQPVSKISEHLPVRIVNMFAVRLKAIEEEAKAQKDVVVITKQSLRDNLRNGISQCPYCGSLGTIYDGEGCDALTCQGCNKSFHGALPHLYLVKGQKVPDAHPSHELEQFVKQIMATNDRTTVKFLRSPVGHGTWQNVWNLLELDSFFSDFEILPPKIPIRLESLLGQLGSPWFDPLKKRLRVIYNSRL